jgi:hypothetical protein
MWTFLKRVKKALRVTIKANGGSLQIWLVVAFLALAAGAMYATVQDSNKSEAGRSAAVRAPASQAPATDPVFERAKECFPTYTNLEWKVYESLNGDSWAASSDQLTITQLTSTKMSACAVQRKVLDYLSRYPRDQRSEVLAGIVDAVQRR